MNPARSPAEATEEPQQLADLAIEMAIAAGELIVEMASKGPAALEVITKSSSVDLVTAADGAAEAMIRAMLARHRPGDGIVGEEDDDKPSETGLWWIIDPIDGTTSFVYGLPVYTVSIGVARGDQIVAGAVHHPGQNHTYSAWLGGGAWRNGEPIAATDKAELSTSLVATGFGYTPEARARQGQAVAGLLPHVRDIRRLGSAALDLCLVASGQVDAYYETGLNLWDRAAGTIIATEAGAVVGDLRGGPPSQRFTMAANPVLFDLLADVLRPLDADSGGDAASNTDGEATIPVDTHKRPR